MRQYKPKLNVSQSVGQTSPPQTPRAASPASSRKGSPHIRDFQYPAKDPMSRASNIRPLGDGPHFSYTRPMGPDELSPRSSSSSSAGSSAVSSSSSESDSDGPSPGLAHNEAEAAAAAAAAAPPPPPLFAPRVRTGRVVTEAAFVLEELSDFDSSDDGERLGAVRPYQVEDAESERSRSLSRPPARPGPAVVDHRTVTRDLRNLHCSDSEPSSSDDDSDLDDAEFREMLLRRRLEKRHRRMTSGSIGKRTISESIGSDSDHEDLKLDAHEVGSSARRLRRRLGDRRSLLFQDPPPRIDELEETIDEWDTEALARELPYYTLEYISMEVDSP